MVHGGLCHDRCQHLWRDLRLRAWHGGCQSDGLPANGAWLRSWTVGHSLHPHPAVLQDAAHLYLSVLGRPLRTGWLPLWGLDVLHQQDAGRLGAPVLGVPHHAVAHLHTIGLALRAERCPHHAGGMALHLPWRREVAHLDRLPQDVVPAALCDSLHLVHCTRPSFLYSRCDAKHHQQRVEPHLLLRQSERETILLEAVLGRCLHHDSHQRAGSGYDAAQSELQEPTRCAEEHDSEHLATTGSHLDILRIGRAALPLCA